MVEAKWIPVTHTGHLPQVVLVLVLRKKAQQRSSYRYDYHVLLYVLVRIENLRVDAEDGW